MARPVRAVVGIALARLALGPLPRLALLARLANLALLVGSLHHLVVAVLVGTAVVPALAALLVEPRAAFAEHAEIMFGELQVIFALHAVAAKLRVARHVLVLLEQLRGIAALPAVLAVARLPPDVRGPLPATAATAAALSVVDQMPTSLRSRS